MTPGQEFSGHDVTQLLISVKNAAEATIVAGCGPDLLDVKAPEQGALGAPTVETLEAVTRVVSDWMPLSFAAGELGEWIHRGKLQPLTSRYSIGLLEKFQFVKIGLASQAGNPTWQQHWSQLFDSIPATVSPVAVAYLDHCAARSPLPIAVIEMAEQHHACRTILFDTCTKQKNLFAWTDRNALSDLIGRARKAGLKTVVAGSVNQACLPQVLSVFPDMVGVRGAVCCGDRDSMIDQRRVNEWVEAFQSHSKIWITNQVKI